MPVLLDLSRGAAALQIARDLRAQRPGVLLFAVVDNRRPDLTTEAVLTGVADVFARPPAPRRLANAIERELQPDARTQARPTDAIGDELYSHSPSMRDVVALISRAAAMRAGVHGAGRGRHRPTGRRARDSRRALGRRRVRVRRLQCVRRRRARRGAVRRDGARRNARGHADVAHGLERVSVQGRLHEAIGGTLYLQNVADASTRVQARLARLLRDREALLGGNRGDDRLRRPADGGRRSPASTRPFRKAAFARSCSAGCPSSASTCRRSETDAKTSRRSRITFCAKSVGRTACRRRRCRARRSRSSRRYRGAATPSSCV